MISINEVKRFWDVRPCNVRHSLSQVGSEAWSEEVTHRKYFVEPHIPKFADFKRWDGKKVLELGCGIGTDTLEFARAGADVTALDLSPVSAELTLIRLKHAGWGHKVALFAANAEEPLPVTGYDLVYSFGVIHHTPRPEKVIENAYRCLKHGGEFRFMVYARYSWKNLVGQQPEAQAGCPIARVYTAREIRKLLWAHGFRDVTVSKDHIFPYRVKDYVQHRYVKEWWFRYLPFTIFRVLERMLGWHLLVTAKK